tara:strand:+ start:195 stop:1007 length:813 start_codon:yes stop_codon:yes gene_type:complete
MNKKENKEKKDRIPDGKFYYYKTLLGKFIKDKSSEYIEPSRKGTPKGEPIGYSRVKYISSLVMLLSYKQESLAEHIGITYQMMRKWAGEDKFKNEVERNCKEFAQIFVKHLSKEIDFQNKALGERIATTKIKDMDKIHSIIRLAEYDDYSFFSLFLRQQIKKYINGLYRNKNGKEKAYRIELELDKIFARALHVNPNIQKSVSKKNQDSFNRIRRDLSRMSQYQNNQKNLESAKKILKQPQSIIKDQKAVYNLNDIKKVMYYLNETLDNI